MCLDLPDGRRFQLMEYCKWLWKKFSSVVYIKMTSERCFTPIHKQLKTSNDLHHFTTVGFSACICQVREQKNFLDLHNFLDMRLKYEVIFVDVLLLVRDMRNWLLKWSECEADIVAIAWLSSSICFWYLLMKFTVFEFFIVLINLRVSTQRSFRQTIRIVEHLNFELHAICFDF